MTKKRIEYGYFCSNCQLPVYAGLDYGGKLFCNNCAVQLTKEPEYFIDTLTGVVVDYQQVIDFMNHRLGFEDVGFLPDEMIE